MMRGVFGLLFAAGMLLCLIPLAYFSASVVEARTPTIAWQVKFIDLTVARGDTTSVDVIATADRNLTNVRVFVVPELAPFISASPDMIPVMNAGVPVSIQLYIDIPSTASLGIYDGAIRLGTQRRTHPAVLNVVLQVGESVGSAGDTIVSEDERAELAIPPGAIADDPLIFTLEEVPLGELIPPPWGELVGPAYDLGPDDAVFLKPLTLTLHYAHGDLPAGSSEASLRIAYETPTGELFGLDGFVVDTVGQTVSADVWHFTRLAIVDAADMTPPDPPTNITADVVPGEPSQVEIDWTNPPADFFHAKIYLSSQIGVLGAPLDTEIKPVCFPEEVGCIEGPPFIDTMNVDLNCYTLRAVDPAGNESPNTDQVCELFAPTMITETVAATGLPTIIPDAGQISSMLNFPTSGSITGMLLEFRFTHECERDLFMDLIAPDGHTVRVMGGGLQRCSGVPELFVALNSEVGEPAFFGGREAAGVWTLVAMDTSSGFSGTLDLFKLSITVMQ